MEPKLNIQFWERMFIQDAKIPEGTIRGYKPARILTDGKEEPGHILDLKELKRSAFIDSLLFETKLGLADQVTDLSRVLQSDKGGKNWYESFYRYFAETYDNYIPFEFGIENIPFAPLNYQKFPVDFFERIEKDRDYRPPEGRINSLGKMKYAKITPPMKFQDGKWLQSVFYDRKVERSDEKIKEGYFISAVGDEPYNPTPGALLGNMTENDLTNIEGDKNEFQGFPLNHFLQVTYPVSFRELGTYNPLTIQMRLLE
ncbi:MAG: hypothetical protein WA139_05710 [Candidatus Aenigmatarchaeota archaeon]